MPRRRRPPRPGALTELPPLRILSQIVALQALYYLAAVVLLGFASLAAGTASSFGLDLVLGWDAVRGDTTQGWLVAFIWVLDGGFCMAVAIIALVSRSKLVPDFALTLHFIHLIITTLYTGLMPRNLLWWIAILSSAALCTALAVWGCQYRELRPITFGGGASTSGATNTGAGSSAAGRGNGGDEDEEQGFGRGRGRRGRGRDGGGEYEMVTMDEAK